MRVLLRDFDTKDHAILAARIEKRDAIQGPRIGDFATTPEGECLRFTHDWGDTIQTTTPKFGHGSFYLGRNGGADYSGALDPGVNKDRLRLCSTRMGKFWFFHHDHATAHNGVEVEAPCRVYELDALVE